MARRSPTSTGSSAYAWRVLRGRSSVGIPRRVKLAFGRILTWFSALLAFLVCHLAGDFLLQTDWQALNKARGLADPVGRRALGHHVSTYMIAFIPALVWIASHASTGRAIAVGVLIATPHLLIDDGHFVRGWLRYVKGVPDPQPGLSVAVDQSFHIVCLLGAALLAAG